MKTFKTKAGTELPFLDLKGKDYLQVAHRLVWFREEHPNGQINSAFHQLTDTYAIFKATIMNDGGEILAIAHGREDAKHFMDFIEKAETKAIGRALAMSGYGTQFAPEFDEGERLADAPLPKKVASPKPVPPIDYTRTTTHPTDFNKMPVGDVLKLLIHDRVGARKITPAIVKDKIYRLFAPKKTLAELNHGEAITLYEKLLEEGV